MRTVSDGLIGIFEGQTGNAQASCAPDEVLTGGGVRYQPDGPNQVNPSIDIQPLTPTIWEFVVTNPGPERVEIQAFGQCAELVDEQ